MTEQREVVAIVEGTTEQIFITSILTPYLANSGVVVHPTLVGKPGHKGGNVKSERVKRDIRLHLRQRSDRWVTLRVDCYGIGQDWPGLHESKRAAQPAAKAKILNTATLDGVRDVARSVPDRFIPYVSMFELEALYFSAPDVLARLVGVSSTSVANIVAQCGAPEKPTIRQAAPLRNDSPGCMPGSRGRRPGSRSLAKSASNA